MFTASSDDLQESSFPRDRRAQIRMTSLRGLPAVSRFHSLSAFSAQLFHWQPNTEIKLNLQGTKGYIPHIPLGQAALHTGNTSLLYLCEPTTNIILVPINQVSKHVQFEIKFKFRNSSLPSKISVKLPGDR